MGHRGRRYTRGGVTRTPPPSPVNSNRGYGLSTNSSVGNVQKAMYDLQVQRAEGLYNFGVGALETNTLSAAKYGRVAQTTNLGSVLRTLLTNLGEKTLVIDQWKSLRQFYSTQPFVVQPFLAILENGEVITTSEADSSGNMSDLIQTALGTGAKDVVYGDVYQSKMVYQNGTPYHTAEFVMNFAPYANKYIVDCKEKEINENSPAYLELLVGIGYAGLPAQSINMLTTNHFSSHQKNYRVNKLL